MKPDTKAYFVPFVGCIGFFLTLVALFWYVIANPSEFNKPKKIELLEKFDTLPDTLYPYIDSVNNKLKWSTVNNH